MLERISTWAFITSSEWAGFGVLICRVRRLSHGSGMIDRARARSMRAIYAVLFYLSDEKEEQIGNDMDRPFEAVLAL